MEIKDRIIEFLRAENISSANFAQEIGVQPSGISHIISGRNKPSLDFIVKMVNRYPSLSLDWVLFGKGKMLKDGIPGNLFSTSDQPDMYKSESSDLFEVSGTAEERSNPEAHIYDENGNISHSTISLNGRKASRIVIFQQDGTFKEYFPG